MKKVLIANRGEIAVRIIKTCREMDIATVLTVSEADANSRAAREADEVVLIGPPPVNESYLLADKIIEAAKQTGAEGIHPGFGFLSENAGFAAKVREAGLIFIGPEAHTIQVMGSKQESKLLMIEAGVPVVPGYTGANQDADFLAVEAERIGFPVLVKASAGGGGKGMRVVHEASRFKTELETAKREALAAFGDDTVLLEKYLTNPRHVEFQVFGDNHGNLVHLFERECSIQRRHQKIVEETPSPAMNPELRQKMADAALAAAAKVGYSGAGTVEFMLDEDESFYFLEMNTRLQVEHPVTEMLTGLDLVRWQIEVARGETLPLKQEEITARGHSIEVRVYAEDPDQNFFPQTGKILRYQEPVGLGVRVDSGLREGDEISIYYDPMIAKLITWGPNREVARAKMVHALEQYCVHGLKHNIAFLKGVLQQQPFIDGDTTTSYLNKYPLSQEMDESWLETALTIAPLAAQAAEAGSAENGSERIVDPWTKLSSWRIAE